MARQEFSSGGFIGKVGKLVGQHWKNIRYIRTYVVPANPDTPKQQLVRSIFAEAVHLSQIAMNFNGHQGIWVSPRLTEWQMRVSQCLRDLRSGLTPEESTPYYPHGYDPSRIMQVVSTSYDLHEVTVVVDSIPDTFRRYNFKILLTAHFTDDKGQEKTKDSVISLPTTGNILKTDFSNPPFITGWPVKVSGLAFDSSLPAGWFLTFPLTAVTGLPIPPIVFELSIISLSFENAVLSVTFTSIPDEFRLYNFTFFVTAHWSNDLEAVSTKEKSFPLPSVGNTLSAVFDSPAVVPAWIALASGQVVDSALPPGWSCAMPSNTLPGTPLPNPSLTFVPSVLSWSDSVLTISTSSIPSEFRGMNMTVTIAAYWSDNPSSYGTKTASVILPNSGNTILCSFNSFTFDEYNDAVAEGVTDTPLLPSIWVFKFIAQAIDGIPKPNPSRTMVVESTSFSGTEITVVVDDIPEVFRQYAFKVLLTGRFTDDKGSSATKESIINLLPIGNTIKANFNNPSFITGWSARVSGLASDSNLPAGWFLTLPLTAVTGLPVSPIVVTLVIQSISFTNNVLSVTFASIPDEFRLYGFRFQITGHWSNNMEAVATRSMSISIPSTGRTLSATFANPSLVTAWIATASGSVVDPSLPVGWSCVMPNRTVPGTPVPNPSYTLVPDATRWLNSVLTIFTSYIPDEFRGKNMTVTITAYWSDNPTLYRPKSINVDIPQWGSQISCNFNSLTFDEYKQAVVKGISNDASLPSIWIFQFPNQAIDDIPKPNPSRTMTVTLAQWVDNELWVDVDSIPSFFRGASYVMKTTAHFSDSPTTESVINFSINVPASGNRFHVTDMDPTIYFEYSAFCQGYLEEGQFPSNFYLNFNKVELEGL